MIQYVLKEICLQIYPRYVILNHKSSVYEEHKIIVAKYFQHVKFNNVYLIRK